MSLKVGDIVQLNKDDCGMNWIMDAEVTYVPTQPGELWGFLDRANGREVYTSEKFTAYVKQRATDPKDTPA